MSVQELLPGHMKPPPIKEKDGIVDKKEKGMIEEYVKNLKKEIDVELQRYQDAGRLAPELDSLYIGGHGSNPTILRADDLVGIKDVVGKYFKITP